MSRWDIFRWRTLAGGPPCRQGRQRFSHQAFLSPRPKRVPPFGISDGGGTRSCAGRWRVALSAPCGGTSPKGGGETWLPLGGAGAVRRLRGQKLALLPSFREATFLVPHRPGKTLRCFPSFLSCAARL